MPPVRRERAVERSDNLGSRYLSWASSTWTLPSPLCALPREDVEDELGAVDDAHLGDVADGLDLRRREVLVEDDQVRAELLGADDELLELAFAEKIPRIDVVRPLDHGVEHGDPVRAGEFLELLDGFFLFVPALLRYAHEDGAVLFRDLDGGLGPLHLAFDVGDEFGCIDVDRVHGLRGQDLVELLLGIRRNEIGDRDVPGEPVGPHGKRGDHVQPEERQVGEVFLVQGLVLQVRMDEPDAAETSGAEPVLRKIGDKDVIVRADEHVPDAAGAVDDEADLSADLGGGFGERAGGLGRDDRVGTASSCGRDARASLFQRA